MIKATSGWWVVGLGGLVWLGCGSPTTEATTSPPRAALSASPSRPAVSASLPVAGTAVSSASPALDTTSTASTVVAIAPSAPPSALPTPSATPSATPPATPSASAMAPPPTPSPRYVALGPFDRSALPKTKLGLIEAVDGALRGRSPELMGKLFLDDSLFGKLCPAADDEARVTMASEQREQRDQAAEAFQECLALVDWNQPKRLALNYGSKLSTWDDACSSQVQQHESSELFYVLDDAVLKVQFRAAIRFGGWHALTSRVRCTRKKPGSAAEAEAFLQRVPNRCPHLPWPRITQARRGCPRF